MEAVGGAASLIALINAISTAAKVSIEAYQNIQDAPAELAQFVAQLLLVKVELEQLNSSEPQVYQWLTTPELMAGLRATSENIQLTLAALHRACPSVHHGKRSIPNRLRWAYLERPAVERLFSQLKRTESSLNVILNLLSVRGHFLVWNEIGTLKQLLLEKTRQKPHEESFKPIESSQSTHISKLKRPSYLRLTKATFLDLFGLTASAVFTTGWQYTTWSWDLRFNTPFPLVFGSRVFAAHLALQRYTLAGCGFSLLPQSSLSLSPLVSEDSPIVSACQRGDIESVQILFQTGQAGPDDRTPDNLTTLGYAIGSGNEKLVERLINSGAHVNGTFGRNQTSPLQWAFQQGKFEIARLLISRGACVAHVSAWGWTPAFYLWPAGEKGTVSRTNYLDIFGNDASIEWEVFDVTGWTVLHRVAAFGFADELEALIRFGANPNTCALPLRWTALHHAVYYGNHETFLILISPKYQACVHSPDARGWTLLHIAASAGHDSIVRHLLSLNADHTHLSIPFMSHMPEVLLNRAVTPGEAALAQSRERYRQYLCAIHDYGLIELQSKEAEEEEEEDEDEGDDIFVDAEEDFVLY